MEHPETAVAVKCYAAKSANAPLEPYTIERRAPISTDVVIGIKFAGICHSDIHTVREEWGEKEFPIVPGHEITGIVREVGADVPKFKVGDVVAVGPMVDSCRECRCCRRGEEQYCQEGMVQTYADKFRFKHCAEYDETGGAATQGGYSQRIVVDYRYVLRVPENLDLARATPLVCAGITTYSPLMYYGLRPSHKLAVVGLGGLGHMGVKFGKAFGAHVTVLSRGVAKKESAIEHLGAHDYLDSTDEAAMKAAKGSFDFVLDTVSAEHDISALMDLLTVNGTLCCVGAPPRPHKIAAFGLIVGRKTVCGSMTGGINESQDMLDFCGLHNIVCDIELISAEFINEAYDRAVRGEVKYRFVIDVSTM